MKNTLIFLLIVIVCSVQAQTSLTEDEYNQVLNNQFSRILSGQSNNTLGSFASIDIVDSSLEFAPTIRTKNGRLFVGEFKAGSSDGLSSIFNNSKLSTNISFKANYHFIDNTHSTKVGVKNINVKRDYEQKQLAERKKNIDEIRLYKIPNLRNEITEIDIAVSKNELAIKKELNSQFVIENLNLTIEIKKAEIKVKEAELAAITKTEVLKVKKKQKEINDLNIEINDLELKVIDLNNYENNINLLENKNMTLNRKKESIKKSIESFNLEFEKFKINTAFKEKYKKNKNEFEVTQFKLGWLSLSYEVNSSKFKLFDGSELFENQIQSEEFVSHTAGIQYSIYKWNSTEACDTYFWTFGANYGYSNNFNDLTKIEISERSEYGTSDGDRNSINKYSAYTGDYKEKIQSVKAYTDFYYFLFHKNRAALHLYPEYKFQDELKPRFNFGIGVLFAFIDSKKDDKSVLNAELYYNFLDVFKATETNYKLFERNNVGVRVTFPINFINSN